MDGPRSIRHARAAFAQELEDALKLYDQNLDVTIHLEPVEAAESWGDHELVPFEKLPTIPT